MADRTARRVLIGLAAVALALAIAGFAGLDGWVATRTSADWPVSRALSSALAVGDVVTQTVRGDFVIGPSIMVAGLLVGRGTPRGRALIGWGASALLTAALVFLMLKPLFGRVRPVDMLARGGEWHDVWFDGGRSFSSGHVAHYAGLMIPLVRLFPRAAPLWIGLSLAVAAQRVLVDAHYLSDVATSMAIAALLSLWLARPWRLKSAPAASSS